MTFLVAVAIGVLAVALFHLGAGWVLSGRLRKSALAVGPRAKNLDVRVREVSRDRIVLEAPGPRQDLGHPGVMGLTWEGGHARLGDVVHVEDGKVTRHFQPIEGQPPPCPGAIEDCPPVEIDPYVFRRSPADAGLVYEPVGYRSPLGEMGAWLVPGTGTRWSIQVHGWSAERREMIRLLPPFHQAGFHTLVIDYRNDPETPSDPSGHYRFGLTEWEDLEGAMLYCLDHGATDVVLGGASTGGAVVMSFLERSPLAGNVVGVVLDSPNVVLVDAFRLGTRDSRATRLMIEFGMWIADLRWNVDWARTDYVSRAEQILRVPTLVFHGTSDRTVPIEVSRRLATKLPDLVELVETTAAGHVMSWNADPAGYERHLRRFLDRL